MPVFFGEKIRNARKSAGLTQKELARQLGVSNTSISNWEKDLSRPSAELIQKLCVLLHLQPNDFYASQETAQAPAVSGRGTVRDEDIKFALFGGDGEITDAMFDEVKRFATYLKQREAGNQK